MTEGDIFQSQPRAVPEEGMEEQEDNSEDGHRALHLDRLVNKSGVECGVCRWGDVKPRLGTVVKTGGVINPSGVPLRPISI